MRQKDDIKNLKVVVAALLRVRVGRHATEAQQAEVAKAIQELGLEDL